MVLRWLRLRAVGAICVGLPRILHVPGLLDGFGFRFRIAVSKADAR